MCGQRKEWLEKLKYKWMEECMWLEELKNKWIEERMVVRIEG